MQDGLVSIDADGDGTADYGLMLDGLDAFDAGVTGWIALPEGWELS